MRRLWRASSRLESKKRPPLKSGERGEGGRESEETGDPGVVLDPRGDKMKKGKVLGDPKRGGSSLNPNLTGNLSSGEEGCLEAGYLTKRTRGIDGSFPVGTEVGLKFRAEGEPGGNRGPGGGLRRVSMERKKNREVVRERSAKEVGRRKTVGVVREDRDRKVKDGRVERGTGDVEAVQAGGDRERTVNILEDTEKRVFVMGGLSDPKVFPKGGELVDERERSNRRMGRGRVRR